ncbi:MAG: pyridoxal phosphate-dependent aminotransferase [Candidatus Marinimicrobia bacterium]|nr:pyridoxal phosphate-dependent aminotransferase [Candidatus Neomarinimicrobiota bacterium]
MKKTPFPLNEKILDKLLIEKEIDLRRVSIRELGLLVNDLSAQSGVDFIRMEFGIPGLPPDRIGPKEEIRVLKENKKLPSIYPPFDGIPRLKKAIAVFVKQFLNVDINPENCVPTVGAMLGCLISMAVAGRRRPETDTILFLDPGFPVNKLQIKFLGLKTESIDMYDYRGENLLKKLEELFSTGKIGGILWSNPNNPTWVCLKEEELEGIGKLATEYDVICIEDVSYFGMDFRKDYSIPGEPPYQPSVAHYTDNYFIIMSSSKIFSYAGQRVGFTILSPELSKKRYPHLKKYADTDIVGHAFVHGGIYPTTGGVPQTTQHALSAILEAVCDGSYNFMEKLHWYGENAAKVKDIFLSNSFEFVYSDDLGDVIADGFYFTIRWENMSGEDLLYYMLLFGMAGIPLSTTGSTKEGIRICISLLKEEQFGELNNRISSLSKYLSITY